MASFETEAETDGAMVSARNCVKVAKPTIPILRFPEDETEAETDADIVWREKPMKVAKDEFVLSVCSCLEMNFHISLDNVVW